MPMIFLLILSLPPTGSPDHLHDAGAVVGPVADLSARCRDLCEVALDAAAAVARPGARWGVPGVRVELVPRHLEPDEPGDVVVLRGPDAVVQRDQQRLALPGRRVASVGDVVARVTGRVAVGVELDQAVGACEPPEATGHVVEGGVVARLA